MTSPAKITHSTCLYCEGLFTDDDECSEFCVECSQIFDSCSQCGSMCEQFILDDNNNMCTDCSNVTSEECKHA